MENGEVPPYRTVQHSEYAIFKAAHFIPREASMEVHLPKTMQGPQRLPRLRWLSQHRQRKQHALLEGPQQAYWTTQ